MNINSFKNFPDSSRIWIFAFREKLAEEKELALKSKLASFLPTWLSHKKEMRGECEIVLSRFLIVLADEELCAASGCSIDSLFRAVRESSEELGIALAD